MRSSAADAQARAAQRAREEARARTRETSDDARREGNGGAIEAASEGGDEIPREDFESAPSGPVEGAAIDEGPRWPDEASESAFLAEQGSVGADGGGTPGGAARAIFTPKKNAEEPTAAAAAAAEAPAALPPLQSLVDRLPASTREVLDDLFRVRFVSVKQIRKDALKS